MPVGFQISFQTLQYAHSDILMRHFTTTETQSNLGLVAVIQKLSEITQLNVVIAFVSAGTEFNFLYQNHFLFQLGFVGFFLFLVFEFTVIHQTANRRLRSWRNLDQIHIGFFRKAEGFS